MSLNKKKLLLDFSSEMHNNIKYDDKGLMIVTVSVCLIVRNEESTLARALECLKDIADEIVIVDTGSTDGTKAMARRYTEKIFDFQWCDDFAAARNFAFSKCIMELIYTADADEVVEPHNVLKLKRLLTSLPEEIDIVQMYYRNKINLGSVYNFETEYRPKLFRRIRHFRWIDPVHETIDTSAHVLDSDIVIDHAPLQSHSKRDFTIFERNAGPEHELSMRLHRLYAQELFICGDERDFLRAEAYFEWTLHEERFSDDVVRQSQCVVAKCCYIKKNTQGLMKVALKNMIGKPSAEVCCILADYYYDQQDYEEAATWYYTAAFGAVCELSIRSGGDLPLLRLSSCYRSLNLAEDAARYEKMAKDWSEKKR